MKVLVYSIFDDKANCFSFPHFNNTNAQAIRAFGDLVANPKTPVASHPEDYSLYQLGEMDDETGRLTSLPAPALLARATEFKPKPTE